MKKIITILVIVFLSMSCKPTLMTRVPNSIILDRERDIFAGYFLIVEDEKLDTIDVNVSRR